MHTTYINRANTNKKVYKMANRAMKDAKKNLRLRPVSRYLKRQQIKYIGHLLREPSSYPTRNVTLLAQGATPATGWRKE
jgi:hypothetical protein